LCLLSILYHVNTNVAEALNIDHAELTVRDYVMGLGYLCLVVFHVSAIVYIFGHVSRMQIHIAVKIGLTMLSLISLFALGAQKVLIDEIARQARLGLAVPEVAVLNGTYVINIAFTMGMFLLLLQTFTWGEREHAHHVSVDETLFTIAQCMGIVSGFMGIWLTFNLIGKRIPREAFWVYVPLYGLFVLPYALAMLSWFFWKSQHLMSGWYDEKQFHDMLKASLTTLLLSIPGVTMFVFVRIADSVYWVVYYLFFLLLIFSSSTVYYFKIHDRVGAHR
jgi:hypothetical protein